MGKILIATVPFLSDTPHIGAIIITTDAGHKYGMAVVKVFESLCAVSSKVGQLLREAYQHKEGSAIGGYGRSLLQGICCILPLSMSFPDAGNLLHSTPVHVLPCCREFVAFCPHPCPSLLQGICCILPPSMSFPAAGNLLHCPTFGYMFRPTTCLDFLGA